MDHGVSKGGVTRSGSCAYTPGEPEKGRRHMPKYNYQDLREEVEQWSSAEAQAIDGWPNAPWETYDEDPEGQYLDTLGDTAGQTYQLSAARKDEMFGLIVLAEAAEASGDIAKADRLVHEIHQNLNEASRRPSAFFTGFGTVSEFDPEPPAVPSIALREDAEHDYPALLRAVDNWLEEQKHDRETGHATHSAGAIGDDASIRFHQMQSQAEDFRARIRSAADHEKRGEMFEADRLVSGLTEALGITDAAVPQIEAYLYEAARKSAFRRRLLVMIGAVLSLGGVVMLLFAALT